MTRADEPTVVRVESPADFAAIAEVVREAFGRDAVVELVARIRSSANYVPELALVAARGDRVVGHTMQSYVALVDSDARHRILTLSPVSVVPDAQRQGVGTALIRAAIDKADDRDEPLIVLEGDPRYYSRFGFRPSKDLGVSLPLPEGVPEEAGMALPLSSHDSSVRGDVGYPPAFDLVTADRSPGPHFTRSGWCDARTRMVWWPRGP
jgi:putative acetyltransferase